MCFLGFTEVTCWVIYYTWREEFRWSFGLKPGEVEYDLLVYMIIVCIDVIVNILLISGANKDYSGQRKDLRYSSYYLIPYICHSALI